MFSRCLPSENIQIYKHTHMTTIRAKPPPCIIEPANIDTELIIPRPHQLEACLWVRVAVDDI